MSSPARSPARGNDVTEYKVFVGGIPWSITDEALCDVFSAYGAERAEVMLDRATQRSRGFGFVIMRDREGFDAAIREKHDTELEGRRISVKSAIPQEQIPPGERGRRGGGERGGYGGRGGGGYGGYGGGGYGGYGGGGGGYGGYGGGYGGGGYGGYGGGGGYGGYGGGYGGYGGGGGDRGYGGGGYDRGYGGGDRGGYGGYGGGGYGGGGYGGGYGDRGPPDAYGGAGPERGARAYTQARPDPYARPR